MENLGSILKQQSFFQGLEDSYIEFIVSCATNAVFKAGEFLFREGQEANYFFLIREGTVNLEIYSTQKGPITVQTLGEGEIVGWSWIISPYQWRFDARAVDATRLIALDGKCLRDKCNKDPKLGYDLLKRFAPIIEQRLVATKIRLLDLYGKDD
jgi:CRP/FNR family transcriptional regulator, cyclic AMP receptor protein